MTLTQEIIDELKDKISDIERAWHKGDHWITAKFVIEADTYLGSIARYEVDTMIRNEDLRRERT